MVEYFFCILLNVELKLYLPLNTIIIKNLSRLSNRTLQHKTGNAKKNVPRQI